MKEEKGKAIFIQILISYVTTLQTKGGRPSNFNIDVPFFFNGLCQMIIPP